MAHRNARPVADLAALRTRLRDIVAPVVAQAGYDLDDLAIRRVGRKQLLRLTVDGDDGVSLDAVAEVSRLVSAALDEAEAAGHLQLDSYDLEVSSPGVDRPLTLPRHWRRNVGRLVQVKAGERLLTGRIRAADGAAVTLEVAGASRVVPLDQLGPGRVQVEFSRLDGLSDEEIGEQFGDDEEGEPG